MVLVSFFEFVHSRSVGSARSSSDVIDRWDVLGGYSMFTKSMGLWSCSVVEGLAVLKGEHLFW